MTARLLGAAVFAFAAFAPDRQLRRRAATAVVPLALTTATLTLIAATVALFAGDLPSAIDPEVSPEASARPRLVGHAVVLALQLAAMALFAAAAAGFARRARRTRDELTAWLAAASVLAAFARLNYFLFPSLYSEWVYTGDLLRLAFYVVLLTGAAREIRRYWRQAAETATLEERRRIARDLHDGLAQELAFIVTEARRLRAARNASLERITTSAERALDESRRAIAALTRPVREPLDVALANEVEHVANRVGVIVKLDVAAGIEVSPAIREELLRIAREAVTNAGKHSHARTIAVSLANGDGLHLRVADDGRGFDPTRVKSAAGSGFGLISMQQRAKALGAEFAVRSRPGEGTEVEVVLR